MSKEVAKRGKAPEPPAASDETPYDVGYKKPPAEHRFKKGKSGNPRGRPKGKKNKLPQLNEERLKDIIIEEAYRTVELREGDRLVSYPIAQAVMRSLAIKAVQGNARAQERFTELIVATESANKKLYDDYRDALYDYKVSWAKELEDRNQTGRVGPEPIPHPDHIVVDMNTGRVHVNGPFTKEEKAGLERLRIAKREFEAEIAAIREDLKTEQDAGVRALMEEDLRRDEKLVAMLIKVVRD